MAKKKDEAVTEDVNKDKAMNFLKTDNKQNEIFNEIREDINLLVFPKYNKYVEVTWWKTGVIRIKIHFVCSSDLIKAIDEYMGLSAQVGNTAGGIYLDYSIVRI